VRGIESFASEGFVDDAASSSRAGRRDRFAREFAAWDDDFVGTESI
jgi:hypothetical protein